MTPSRSVAFAAVDGSRLTPIQDHISRAIDDLIASLPEPDALGPSERRGIIARYTAVLEPNFIPWMTAAYLGVVSDEARSIIRDNLLEELRDNHPGMLRRFAIAARAVPTDSDALAIQRSLQEVRRFVARLSGSQTVLMMAFFEGFITRFMPFLATLAAEQGSPEHEYTDVHGPLDIVHTQELFRALDAELGIRFGRSATLPTPELFEGVALLQTLIHTIIHPAMPDHSPRAGTSRDGTSEAHP